MRSFLDRTLWWQERQRTLLLKAATIVSILVGEGYEILYFLAG